MPGGSETGTCSVSSNARPVDRRLTLREGRKQTDCPTPSRPKPRGLAAPGFSHVRTDPRATARPRTARPLPTPARAPDPYSAEPGPPRNRESARRRRSRRLRTPGRIRCPEDAPGEPGPRRPRSAPSRAPRGRGVRPELQARPGGAPRDRAPGRVPRPWPESVAAFAGHRPGSASDRWPGIRGSSRSVL